MKKTTKENTKQSSGQILFIDSETKSRADITSVGGWLYTQDSSTEIILGAYRFSDWQAGRVEFFTADTIPAEVADFTGVVVAHNWTFEHGILSALADKGKVNASYKNPDRYECTAATAARMALPRSLEKASEALELKNKKLSREGRALILRYSVPDKKGNFRKITESDFQLWKEYNKADVLAMEELFYTLPRLMDEPFESRVFRIDQRMNLQGVKIDRQSAREILDAYNAQLSVIKENAKTLCGVEAAGALTVSSTVGFKKWLGKMGAPVDNVQEATLDAVYAKTKNGIIQTAIEYRRAIAAAAPKKLEAMLATSDADGIARHFLLYAGAHTLRWSGRGFQIQNLPRATTKDFNADKAALVSFLSDDPAARVSKLLRGLIIPRKGSALAVCDLAAIEARVLFYLSGCTNGLDVYRTGGNIYKEFAGRVFNKPTAEIEKGSLEYQVGKSAVLGLGYGMGVNRFYEYCKIDLELAEKTVKLYRDTYKAVPKFWWDIENAFRKTISTGSATVRGLEFKLSKSKSFMRVKLLSGRYQYYFEPAIDDDGSISCEINGGRKKLWGGMLVENLVQGTARDIICDCLFRLEGSKLLKPVFTVHDEIVCEVKTKDAKKGMAELLQVMTTAPDWLPGFPLGAEGETMTRYGK